MIVAAIFINCGTLFSCVCFTQSSMTFLAASLLGSMHISLSKVGRESRLFISKAFSSFVRYSSSQIPSPSYRRSSLQKSNETRRVLLMVIASLQRQDEPKKITSVQRKINSRPRQKLRFETPKAEFFKRIA